METAITLTVFLAAMVAFVSGPLYMLNESVVPNVWSRVTGSITILAAAVIVLGIIAGIVLAFI